MDNKVQMTCDYSKTVNFAMQQNSVPIIKRLLIKNVSEAPLREFKIIITTNPKFAEETILNLDYIEPEQTIEIDTINIRLFTLFLFSLTEKIRGCINISIISGDETLLEFQDEIDILAYDEWSGTYQMPELIASFVTPNHPLISKVIVNATHILKSWGKDPSFTGYQSQNPNMVRLQMAAIYGALQTEGIVYSMPPASFEVSGQRIRLSDQVLNTKIGTCLDLSVLYASCLEAIGLNPIIIFIKGHAFIGCWLEDESFAEMIEDECSVVRKRIAEGIDEICVVETTGMVVGKNVTFDNAITAATNHLSKEEEFQLLVDVKRARVGGIRPLPQRVFDENGKLIESDVTTGKGHTENFVTSIPREISLEEKLKYVDNIKLTKQQVWERNLLDLSLRNTLLNFKASKNAIQLMSTSIRELEDALSSGEEFVLMSKPKDFTNSLRDAKIYEANHEVSFTEELLFGEMKNKRLRTYTTEEDLGGRILNLYRTSKTSLEENGVNTLYLALGFLRWYETNESEKARYAPIILLPIDIIRKSVIKGYVIRVRDEEPQMNITLLEMLRADYGIGITGLDPLPMDESGLDVSRIFSIMRQAVMIKPKWDVEEISFIGLFSFSQFIMWNDIRNRSDELIQNKVVKSLMSGKMEWDSVENFPSPNTLDDDFSPVDMAIPVSADSTQLAAICAASKGESFVLHGPPGTGKSQTITNMIANALFQGKSVLFIAEKMAALSVVQKRLDSIGLGPFCLEVHSNKAKKRDVLEQLNQTLNYGKVKAPEEYDYTAKRLHELRKELNELIHEVHKRKAYGDSLYAAIAKAEQYEEYPDCITFSSDAIGDLDSVKYSMWIDICQELKVVGIAANGIYDNPLKSITSPVYTINKKNDLVNYIIEYKKRLISLQNNIELIYKSLNLTSVVDYKKVEGTYLLCDLIKKIDYMPTSLLSNNELSLLKDKVDLIYESGKKRDEIESILGSIFDESIYSYNDLLAARTLSEAENSWFIPKIIKKNKIVKELKSHVKDMSIFDKKSIARYVSLLVSHRESRTIINKEDTLFSGIYGLFWNKGYCNFEQFKNMYQQGILFNQSLNKIFDDVSTRNEGRDRLLSAIFMDLEQYKSKNNEIINNVINEFTTIISIEMNLTKEYGIIFDNLHDTDWFVTMEEKLNLWNSHENFLREWCSYLITKKKALDLGLSNIIEGLESGKVDENIIMETFYRNISRALAMSIIEENPILNQFNGAVFEQMIEKFKSTSFKFDDLTKHELIARLSAKIPVGSMNFTSSSEIGILQKAIKSGGRAMSIRKLFDSIPNLLHRLCPCMLMSPISVAQYIDPSYPPFDLVIFDEASQLPTAKAVGAIARGKNLVVVGDPKQLPPTSFFSTNRVDEENYDKEDLESILDDCLAISMPQEHLLWHYRSRHESLIAFSNRMFYENKLYTFPSPNDLVSEVKHVLVEGYYDKCSSRSNMAEARAVVSEIIRRLRDPLLREESIGVVTFSKSQQNVIDDLLMEEFAKEPSLEEYNNQLHEPLFIKNLENVQGDERDVIMFSICYGPDKVGNVSMNFGPLNQEGGFRRLNVAVTRSRKEMIVFSVLRPEQIDLSRTTSAGVTALKSFLEFAMRGNRALVTKQSDMKKTSIELDKFIGSKITELGYEVRTNIGSSEFKIDIGIVNPNNKEEYILGILLDTDRQSNSGTARDRNILKESVLKSLGWNIYQIFVLDWFDSNSKVLNKVKSEINKALTQENDIEYKSSIGLGKYQNPIEFEREILPLEIINDGLKDYNSVELTPILLGVDAFHYPENERIILEQIKQIMNAEAPISRTLLCKKILSAWGITRLGSNLSRRMEYLLSKLSMKFTREENEIYYWLANMDSKDYREFRVPMNEDTRRNIEDISLEELGAGLSYIVNNQLSLTEDDLCREIAKVFGFARCTLAMKERFILALNLACERGYVTCDKERISVVK